MDARALLTATLDTVANYTGDDETKAAVAAVQRDISTLREKVDAADLWHDLNLEAWCDKFLVSARKAESAADVRQLSRDIRRLIAAFKSSAKRAAIKKATRKATPTVTPTPEKPKPVVLGSLRMRASLLGGMGHVERAEQAIADGAEPAEAIAKAVRSLDTLDRLRGRT